MEIVDCDLDCCLKAYESIRGTAEALSAAKAAIKLGDVRRGWKSALSKHGIHRHFRRLTPAATFVA